MSQLPPSTGSREPEEPELIELDTPPLGPGNRPLIITHAYRGVWSGTCLFRGINPLNPPCGRTEAEHKDSQPMSSPPTPLELAGAREVKRLALYAEVAESVSRLGTCPRAQMGAVLVDKHHRILATGYNGAPRGEPHCEDVGCEVFAGHCVRAVHAEVNLLNNLEELHHDIVEAVYGDLLSELDEADDVLELSAPDGWLEELGCTVYVWGDRQVCSHCARLLHEAGVENVVTLRAGADDDREV